MLRYRISISLPLNEGQTLFDDIREVRAIIMFFLGKFWHGAPQFLCACLICEIITLFLYLKSTSIIIIIIIEVR